MKAKISTCQTVNPHGASFSSSPASWPAQRWPAPFPAGLMPPRTIRSRLPWWAAAGTAAAPPAWHMTPKGPTKLVAMADAFVDRLSRESDNGLSKQVAEQAGRPEERLVKGLDAYRKAIDAMAPGGVCDPGHSACVPADPLRVRGRRRAAMSSWRSRSPSMRRAPPNARAGQEAPRRTPRSPAA